MLLTIDIGNSSVRLSFFDGSDEVRHRIHLGTDKKRTADEYAVLMEGSARLFGIPTDTVTEAVLSSVVPSLTYTVSKAVRTLCPNLTGLSVVGPGMRTGFLIRTDNPAEVGTDIVANTAYAVKNYPHPILIADFGTMTVLTVVNENGELTGNSILPGIRTMFQTMPQYAAQLPDLDVGGSDPSELPLLGKNTVSSIRSGILHSHAFAVDAYAEAFEKELHHPLTLLVTGGFANLVCPLLRHPSVIEPDLTAKGLYLLGTMPQKKSVKV